MAPKWSMWMYDKKAVSPGYWFIAPYENVDQAERGSPWVGPYIYDQRGEVVWAGTPLMDHYKAFDLRVANIKGDNMLSIIYPHDNAGLILNNHYEIVKKAVYSSDFSFSNMHDFNVIANGDRALVLAKEKKSSVPAPWAESVGVKGDCNATAEGLKEVDISGAETKDVFVWNGTDHIGADETTFTPQAYEDMCEGSWDIHHFNSVDQFPDGDYLLSSRHTDTLYKVSHINGSIIWRLGGTKSDFELGTGVRFTRQHHARVHIQNSTHVVVTVFDNAKGTGGDQQPASNDMSRGLRIALDLANMKADLLAAYNHPRRGITNSRGSNQILPDDNVFMCWAYHTLISEHAPDGRKLMEARLKKNIHTYRSYKYEWVGRPKTPPDVYAASYNHGNHPETYAYVSWNGATEVAIWNLYETDALGEQRRLINSTWKRGFETKFVHYGYPRYVIVEAFDRDVTSLGLSKVFETIVPVEGAPQPHSDSPSHGMIEPEDGMDDSDPTIDFDMNDETYAVKPDSTSWTTDDKWMSNDEEYDIFANPITIFLTGFVSCVLACVVFWAAWRYRPIPVWRSRVGAYEQVGKSLHGEGGEHETFVEGETLAEEHVLEKV
jgi:hypothetical protein